MSYSNSKVGKIKHYFMPFIERFGPTELELSTSHDYCSKLKLAKNQEKPKTILSPSLVRKVRVKLRPYLLSVFPTFSELYKELPDGLACFLTNQYLINLYTIAKNPTRFQCRYQGLIPGTVFHERSAGTNAISMCNKLKRPVFLLGSQHYLIEMFSNKWFIADRVCLPNGEPLWIFALSAPLDKDPRMLIFLVQMLIKRLEHMVRRTWFTKQKVAELQKKASSFTLKPLTQRELEILSHLVDGKSYKEIANTLFLSLGTVNTYVYHIYSKLNVSSRKELRHKLSVNIPDMSF